ncbi:PREDICTED: uncharacterized protein LOC104595133 isoform X1 [Nelumbo nucifera]|uniref:Uncharacterized protein LOC104595133 isoform X1 n=1 Tax=Nelumbo nucifera TaxID=4432 RepID=A0A1U7ZQ47_NELNU|nr:PREDICTED: uncharacterized protein LOC104595133 isoform X1 [Nelumbo nucifera]
MIAFRYLFFRVDRVWKAANAYVLSEPVGNIQGYSAYHGVSHAWRMGRKKGGPNSIDSRKKQKAFSSVWRPVCTQSSAREDVPKSEEGKSLSELTGPSNSRELQYNLQKEVLEENISTFSANVRGEILPQDQFNSSETKPGEMIHEVQIKEDSAFGSEAEENVHLASKTERHSISVEVAASLIRFIEGKGGSTQKQIEEEMGVKIVFPSSKKENSITIEGVSVESVTKASEKVQVILDEAVKSPNLDYSHFVSLPLAIHPGLVDKLINFQNSILGNTDSSLENLDSDSSGNTDGEDKDQLKDEENNVAVTLKVEDDNEHVKVEINKIAFKSYPPKASKSSNLSDLGIERSIFIKPKTFHLTVLMLKLWNEERVAAATEVLQRISSRVMDALDGRPVSVRLKGLECMRGSLAKAHVLYTPVEEIDGENRLLRACQVIFDAYGEAGLVLEKDARQKLKLHATVMNARHRKRRKRRRKSDSFDARDIVKQFGSEEWGEYLIREAHLSQRFVYDDDGYYHCCAKIHFPEFMQVES